MSFGLTLSTCIDFQFFGHFGNLVNQIKGSGCGHKKFLPFGTSLHKMKHPNPLAMHRNPTRYCENPSCSKIFFHYKKSICLVLTFQNSAVYNFYKKRTSESAYCSA